MKNILKNLPLFQWQASTSSIAFAVTSFASVVGGSGGGEQTIMGGGYGYSNKKGFGVQDRVQGREGVGERRVGMVEDDGSGGNGDTAGSDREYCMDPKVWRKGFEY